VIRFSSLQGSVSATRSGQAIAELAVLLPFLLVLVLGVIDFSPALVAAAQSSQAAHAGTDYAHYKWTDTSGIRNRAKLAAPALQLADGDITVTCYSGMTTSSKLCSDATVGDSVNVRVSFTYQPTTWAFAGLLGSALVISRSMVTTIY
jgi:Flp pilus assembly protein TadG